MYISIYLYSYMYLCIYLCTCSAGKATGTSERRTPRSEVAQTEVKPLGPEAAEEPFAAPGKHDAAT